MRKAIGARGRLQCLYALQMFCETRLGCLVFVRSDAYSILLASMSISNSKAQQAKPVHWSKTTTTYKVGNWILTVSQRFCCSEPAYIFEHRT